MKKETYQLQQLILILFTTAILVTAIVFTITYFFTPVVKFSFETIIFQLIPGIFMIVGMLLFLYMMRKTSTSVVISILGFPSSGKTTFLTILFKTLQINPKVGGITFAPYGEETIEKVTVDYSDLCDGNWLPPSPKDKIFFYRCHAVYGLGLIRRNYKIEIPDTAGEHFSEIEKDRLPWLHKQKYFRYIIESDAIMMVVDTDYILKNKSTIQEIKKLEGRFIAEMNIVLTDKGVVPTKKMKTPVALLFTKADVLISNTKYDMKENRQKALLTMESYLPDLVKWCKEHCSNFEIFLVSSVGYLENGHPPKELKPFGVIDAISWILRYF